MNREQMIGRLKSDRVFDLLVIGAGASGSGVALDAATRGLNVAQVERFDFAQGTSSKSTKLVHGGVRYLEKAVKSLDREQFSLVREGLLERGRLLRNAPHLAHPIRLMTPVESWKEGAYVFAGLTLYDMLAGRLGLGRSRLVSRREAARLFPELTLNGHAAAVIYFDGQFNDSRMAVALVRTAAENGAACGNHVEVLDLLKEKGRVRGAQVRDCLTGEEWTIRARGVVNATGPFADSVRRMDDGSARDILKVSSGIHIALDASLAPPDLSLMIPKTEDGRVLFMIPWQGVVIFGTTDEPSGVEADPVPSQQDIDYLLAYAKRYLKTPITREDIRSAWSGLRPLVFSPGKSSTQELARTHVIELSPGGLLTITGGKWTSYRRMAEDTVDKAVEAFGLSPRRSCITRDFKLLGGRAFIPGAHEDLAARSGLDGRLAKSLCASFGDEAPRVVEIGRKEGLLDPLHPGCPHIGAEVAFCARHEMPAHLEDVLIRRLPLGESDIQSAKLAAPAAADIMAAELGWDRSRRNQEVEGLSERLAGWFPPVGGGGGQTL